MTVVRCRRIPEQGGAAFRTLLDGSDAESRYVAELVVGVAAGIDVDDDVVVVEPATVAGVGDTVVGDTVVGDTAAGDSVVGATAVVVDGAVVAVGSSGLNAAKSFA